MKRSTLFVCIVINLLLPGPVISLAGKDQPFRFRENKGQVSDQFYKKRTDVLYSGNAGGLFFHLRNNGISYQFTRVDEWAAMDDRFLRNSHSTHKVPVKSTIYRV